MASQITKRAPRVSTPGAHLCLILLCLLTLAPPAAAQQDAGIRWLSYAETLAQGPRAGKPVFVFFRAPWCYFCTKMQRQVFPSPQLSTFLNQRFLAVDVDVTKERRVAEVYQVNYLPTSLFLADNGKTVLILKGYLSSERLLKALHFVADGHYKKMSFQAYEDKNGLGGSDKPAN